MALPLTQALASFLDAILGSFLYGLFFNLAILSTVLHIQRIMHRNQSTPHRTIIGSVLRNPMIMTGFALFFTVTARWVVDMIGTASELLDPESNNPEAPTRLTTILEFCLVIASLMICDAMIVYRLWIVWNKSTLVAIFPFLTLFGMLASAIGFIHQLTMNPRGASLSSNELGRWIVIDSVFNLVTNVYSTGLIAYRIYTIHSQTGLRPMGGTSLKSVIAIMVESSVLLSAWIVFGMIVHGTKLPLDNPVISTLGTVSGISFMLINVRVALSWSHTDQILSGSRGSESINRAYPATTPLTRVRMETQVDVHVEMPRKGNTDAVYELGAV
ncbi:hypothetical protein K438DRAFT_1798192 [Mycena galopus ATCC 62051]|nr:hypothetical protein K438DRAFT_1798192 [Mycena galopus ATCC 62051]